MKAIRYFLLAVAMTGGLSLATAAQKHDDGKKPPPKNPPPVVTPEKKAPPSDSHKPKRPGEAFLIIWRREDVA